jgi:hypothetical protein
MYFAQYRKKSKISYFGYIHKQARRDARHKGERRPVTLSDTCILNRVLFPLYLNICSFSFPLTGNEFIPIHCTRFASRNHVYISDAVPINFHLFFII